MVSVYCKRNQLVILIVRLRSREKKQGRGSLYRNWGGRRYSIMSQRDGGHYATQKLGDGDTTKKWRGGSIVWKETLQRDRGGGQGSYR